MKKVTYKVVVQRIRRDLARDKKRLVVGRGLAGEAFTVDENDAADRLGYIMDYAKANGYIKDGEEVV